MPTFSILPAVSIFIGVKDNRKFQFCKSYGTDSHLTVYVISEPADSWPKMSGFSQLLVIFNVFKSLLFLRFRNKKMAQSATTNGFDALLK